MKKICQKIDEQSAVGAIYSPNEHSFTLLLDRHLGKPAAKSVAGYFAQVGEPVVVLSELSVAEQVRGHGLGTDILCQFLDDAAFEHEAQAVIVLCDAVKRPQIHQWFQARGFSLVYKGKGHYLMVYPVLVAAEVRREMERVMDAGDIQGSFYN